MKNILLILLLCIFSLTISAQKKSNEIDLRVKGIGSGSSYAAVIRTLGKPNRRETEKYKAENFCTGSDATHLTLFYSGLEVVLLGNGKGKKPEVYSIKVKSKKWTASGIKLGATKQQVQARFGTPNSEEKKSGEKVFHYVTKENLGNVNFHFRNNKLVRIEMTETLC